VCRDTYRGIQQIGEPTIRKKTLGSRLGEGVTVYKTMEIFAIEDQYNIVEKTHITAWLDRFLLARFLTDFRYSTRSKVSSAKLASRKIDMESRNFAVL
jgi:hypothetical protein